MFESPDNVFMILDDVNSTNETLFPGVPLRSDDSWIRPSSDLRLRREWDPWRDAAERSQRQQSQATETIPSGMTESGSAVWDNWTGMQRTRMNQVAQDDELSQSGGARDHRDRSASPGQSTYIGAGNPFLPTPVQDQPGAQVATSVAASGSVRQEPSDGHQSVDVGVGLPVTQIPLQLRTGGPNMTEIQLMSARCVYSASQM